VGRLALCGHPILGSRARLASDLQRSRSNPRIAARPVGGESSLRRVNAQPGAGELAVSICSAGITSAPRPDSLAVAASPRTLDSVSQGFVHAWTVEGPRPENLLPQRLASECAGAGSQAARAGETVEQPDAHKALDQLWCACPELGRVWPNGLGHVAQLRKLLGVGEREKRLAGILLIRQGAGWISRGGVDRGSEKRARIKSSPGQGKSAESDGLQFKKCRLGFGIAWLNSPAVKRAEVAGDGGGSTADRRSITAQCGL